VGVKAHCLILLLIGVSVCYTAAMETGFTYSWFYYAEATERGRVYSWAYCTEARKEVLVS
jgi:hypothetical protein